MPRFAKRSQPKRSKTLKVTNLKSQVRSADRVNVYIDDVYSFSLDLSQVIELGVKVGKEYTEEELEAVKVESEYGKLYTRALEYVLMRPHSSYEVQQYLYRKTRPIRTKDGQLKPGYSSETADRVYARLSDRGYLNDVRFAEYWMENRRLNKGASRRLLQSELSAKGVSSAIIEAALADSSRSDKAELQKVIAKKSTRYSDKTKFIQYLMRQGFRYDDIAEELSGWGG